MGTDKTRRQKQEWFEFMFRASLMEDKRFIELDTLLAEFCHKCLSTNKTGRAILSMFQKLGWIVIKGNEIEVLDVTRQKKI
jgi:hypothetical protein